MTDDLDDELTVARMDADAGDDNATEAWMPSSEPRLPGVHPWPSRWPVTPLERPPWGRRPSGGGPRWRLA
jgi:hypothetical protein